MPDVEITVSNPSNPESQYLKVAASGAVADALRSCILRVADQYAADPDVQALADAVATARHPR